MKEVYIYTQNKLRIFIMKEIFIQKHFTKWRKKKSDSDTLFFFFRPGSHFVGKIGIMMKIYKNVHLRLKVSKMWFGRNFCHFRASEDPLKFLKSQKIWYFSGFRLPIGENRPFFVRNFGARTLTLFHSGKKISGLQHAWRLQMRVEKAGIYCFHF